MSFFPYFMCALLGVDSLRGGLAEGNRIHWGIIFSPKMMVLQGVGHLVPYLGVSYANDPQNGGYMVYAPALDLTTLFEVFWRRWRYGPHTAIFQNSGGGGGAEGCCIQGPGPADPPGLGRSRTKGDRVGGSERVSG